MPCKCGSDIISYGGAALNLSSCPYTKLQYVLEFLGQIVPSIVIAGRVRGQIVIDIVNAASAMGDNVIGLPLLVLDLPATNVTATRSLGEDLSSFRGGQ